MSNKKPSETIASMMDKAYNQGIDHATFLAENWWDQGIHDIRLLKKALKELKKNTSQTENKQS